MKKIPAALLFLAVITLVSCAPKDSADISAFPQSTYKDFVKDVSAQVNTKDITSTVDSVSIMLTNHGDLDYSFGEEFALEVLDGEDWRSVPQKDTASSTAIGYLLPCGGISTFTGRIQDCYGELIEGKTYRIIKTLTASSGAVNISAEFSVK